MPRTPEQYEEIRSEKKQTIMDAALDLFANEGYHATSISNIAEKANISKGLMYNYFTSKEELLGNIVKKFSREIIEMMNPDHDEKITQEEALQFIDLYFNMITTRTEHMKLYWQLTMQPFITETIKNMTDDEKSLNTQKLFILFLKEKNKLNPEEAYLTLTSAIKGFGIQYVLAPDSISEESIENFKNYLKQTFIL